jgi:hypothetical protein
MVYLLTLSNSLIEVLTRLRSLMRESSHQPCFQRLGNKFEDCLSGMLRRSHGLMVV